MEFGFLDYDYFGQHGVEKEARAAPALSRFIVGAEHCVTNRFHIKYHKNGQIYLQVVFDICE